MDFLGYSPLYFWDKRKTTLTFGPILMRVEPSKHGCDHFARQFFFNVHQTWVVHCLWQKQDFWENSNKGDILGGHLKFLVNSFSMFTKLWKFFTYDKRKAISNFEQILTRVTSLEPLEFWVWLHYTLTYVQQCQPISVNNSSWERGRRGSWN